MSDTRIIYDVRFFPGATIQTLVSKAIPFLEQTQFDMTYFIAGANNLTTKHSNGQVSPKYREVGNLVEVLTDYLSWAKNTLLLYTNCVIIGHLVGVCIDAYNKYKTSYTAEQDVINSAIIHVNRAIVAINNDTGLTTPMLQDSIHALMKGKRYHRYHKLTDGVHQDDHTTQQWANQIHKSVIKNGLKLSLI